MKKIILIFCSVILTCSLVFAEAVPAWAWISDNKFIQPINLGYSDSDTVTFIVEVDGDPLLASRGAAQMGVDYIHTEDADKKESLLLRTQGDIIDSIETDTNENVKLEAVYTLLFNGFAIKASYGDMEKIKSIPNVKNVFIAEDIKLETHLTGSTSVIDTQELYNSGYTGKGQLIAIIDSEFDTTHPFFSAAPAGPKYATMDEMARVITSAGLNDSIDSTKSFISQKIPFAYDYCDNDYILKSNKRLHGTHVAGIAGGKNGTYNGNTINGVAPDSQLILMKVADANGGLNVAFAFKAIEDAAKLGANVINFSLGTTYTSPAAASTLETQYLSAHNAGIIISTSNGNSGRGFAQKDILTDNIDYSTSGIPATFDSSFAVGSVYKTAPYAMADSSSYGVTENLKLKPNISAPGVSIVSSWSEGGYKSLDGTSMAAPHIAGLCAIMNEFFDENHPEIIGMERALLIKNMLMSTAIPARSSNSAPPYSPRVQGAGVANAARAVRTPAILIGSDGLCQINLGDGLESRFKLSFTAKNLTNTQITYDRPSVVCLTDGYKTKNNKNYVSRTSGITISSAALPDTVVIEPGEEKIITLDIQLNTDMISKISQIYKNGFFIDGFVTLGREDASLPPISIPFMGFYGDWTKASVFDTTLYDEGGSSLSSGEMGVETMLISEKSELPLGYNGDGGFDTKYIAVSPNNNTQSIELAMQITAMRTMSQISLSVLDEAKKTEGSNSYNFIFNKFDTKAFALSDLTGLPDGDYYVSVKGTYNYQKENAMVHSLEIPFYIDTVSPEIIRASMSDGTVSIITKDNKHISKLDILYADSSGAEQTLRKYVPNPEENANTVITFELDELDNPDIELKDIHLKLYDMAENTYSNALSCVMGDIHPLVVSYSYRNTAYNLSLDIDNFKPDQACTLILAFYSDDGALVHAHITNNEQLKNGVSTVNFAGKAVLPEKTEYKLFILNSLDTLTPLDISKTLNIN